MSDNFANLTFRNGEVTFNSSLKSTLEIGNQVYFNIGVIGTYVIIAKEQFASLFENEPDRFYFTGKLVSFDRIL